MFVTLKKYQIFRDALGDNYVYNENIFEQYEEDGMNYERLKDIDYAKKVLDAYCEVERYNIRHPEPYREISDKEAEKIARENERRWKRFGNYYYEMFRLFMAAHNAFLSKNMKHNELIKLSKIALEL